MNSIDKILNIVCAVMLALDALVVLLFETETILPGALALDMNGFVLDTVCALVTLAGIPLALKMMFTTRVRTIIMRSDRDYLTMALIRLGLLLIPAHLCLVMYYVCMSSTTLGCAIISTIALLYVWPTQSRRVNETTLPGMEPEYDREEGKH